jgi:CubicO group peptidase (beta-lactamase class C family)
MPNNTAALEETTMLTRRAAAKSLILAAPFLSASAHAATGKAPGADWEKATPQERGFMPDDFAALELELCTLPTTAFMVVSGGKQVYGYGDLAQSCYLASARKSILPMLYGKYMLNGTIDLDKTMADLGIDEVDGLLPIEKTAQVRDLLIASSGVYHPTGSPGDDPNSPPRGSKQPGTFFHYNNWDFNVLGTIFEKATGKKIFAALDEELAKPLQFQDFDLSRQRMMGFERQSPAWAGSFMASGQFGQFILVLPAIDTVIVHRRAVTDEHAALRNLGKTRFEPTRVLGPDFLKLADKVVAAKA